MCLASTVTKYRLNVTKYRLNVTKYRAGMPGLCRPLVSPADAA